LLSQFRIEEIIYNECVRHLFPSNTSEADFPQLSIRGKPNQLLWKDQALAGSLLNRLGHEKSSLALKTVQEIEKLLTTLSENMLNIYETPVVSLSIVFSAMVYSLTYA
jgi:hypothetical protein